VTTLFWWLGSHLVGLAIGPHRAAPDPQNVQSQPRTFKSVCSASRHFSATPPEDARYIPSSPFQGGSTRSHHQAQTDRPLSNCQTGLRRSVGLTQQKPARQPETTVNGRKQSERQSAGQRRYSSKAPVRSVMQVRLLIRRFRVRVAGHPFFTLADPSGLSAREPRGSSEGRLPWHRQHRTLSPRSTLRLRMER
jgi:hypothetical protein